jgi:hydroxymethylpyrimidine/phosphomethylpyrimidine kinase
MKQVLVLCVGGSDSSGGAGIQADLKAVSACGCYGMSVITGVTVQNTRGVQLIHQIPKKYIMAQLDSVLSDIGADAVKTGMLLTSGAVESVVLKVKQYHLEKLIVDPVMIAKGGQSLMRNNAMVALIKKLLPLSLVVTPNIPDRKFWRNVKLKELPG